jgi:DNA polymerase I-like protein with 3'-5' exonuclease and polymerase domains
MFVADAGYTFVQADYAQGELRLVTTLSQCSYFHELFNDPTADPIGTTQRELFGSSPNDTAETIKEKRTRTKNIVYGSLYGMIMGRGKQGKKYAKILGMTNDESYAYQRRFFGLAPEILQWQDETRQRVLDGETLETVFGRKLRIPTEVLILDEKARIDALNECLAFVPQSTLSDICVAAMCELVESGEDIRISIHDALVAHCLVSDKYIVADRLTHAMGNAAKLAIGDYVPFTVEAKAGKNWGELG